MTKKNLWDKWYKNQELNKLKVSVTVSSDQFSMVNKSKKEKKFVYKAVEKTDDSKVQIFSSIINIHCTLVTNSYSN